VAHIRKYFTKGKACEPNTSDATLLGLVLRSVEIEALRCAADGSGRLEECVELASWIAAMERDCQAPAPPDSPLTRDWFDLGACRGVRRQWARRRGLDAGSRGARALDPWISAWGENLPESYGSMIVEWTLAVIRAWPDRQRMVHEDCPELSERAASLKELADVILKSCHGMMPLREWLESGVRGLTETPAPMRRVRRGRERISSPGGKIE
jgi:hypothetical protein